MASTVWKGRLAFGLVSIPIKIYRAARPEKVSFHYVERATGARVQQRLYRPPEVAASEPEQEPEPVMEAPPPRRVSGTLQLVSPETAPTAPPASEPAVPAPQPIARQNLLKGYEFEPERFVTFEPAEIQRIAPKTSDEISILEFVKFSEIDPIYLETSYYVTPDRGGEKPYALLFGAMRKAGYAALGELTMHRRTHVVILRPGEHGILMHTMFYASEVRKDQEFHADVSAVAPKEMDLAVTLIDALKERFEPEKFKDTYLENLKKMIAAKVQGEEVREAPAAKTAPVVDIMEALRKSLANMKKPMGTAQPASPKKKTARKAGGGAS